MYKKKYNKLSPVVFFLNIVFTNYCADMALMKLLIDMFSYAGQRFPPSQDVTSSIITTPRK